ncbi:hypothetical protein [Aurantimonas marianensis]|uniref:Curlin associated repeat-containing protein n=1 Tax=Aurantimonas marianensis TaxID=2920428 RepID=A0A9X2KEH0_9HYPH|nr:hypothetical protein [Aurantimonas marianensis]MCP3054446.1 hypothetical protein [Aurantimonas marianensis]
MASVKKILMAATALTFMSGVAYSADGNEQYSDQSGTNNSIIVEQSGSNNQAGSSTTEMTQQGFRNQLSITQSGDNNDIGLNSNANGGAAGIFQNSNRTGADANQITIEQSSDGNVVGAISQNSGGTNTFLGRNIVDITQGGAGANTIGSMTQSRGSSSGNTADITQTGTLNNIARVYQRTTQGGNQTNRLTVNMSGDNNGNGVLSGAASVSGAQSSTLIQGDLTGQARDSFADLSISGDNNQFGVSQYGQSNTVGNLVISGNANQLGVNQNGSRNALALSTISGNNNNIGLDQDGQDNMATINISGDFNGGGTLAGAAGTLAAANGLVSGLIKQDGLNNQSSLAITSSDNNQFAFLQDGNDNVIVGNVSGAGSNSATMVQIGGNNTSNFSQSGAGNMVSVNQ